MDVLIKIEFTCFEGSKHTIVNNVSVSLENRSDPNMLTSDEYSQLGHVFAKADAALDQIKEQMRITSQTYQRGLLQRVTDFFSKKTEFPE